MQRMVSVIIYENLKGKVTHKFYFPQSTCQYSSHLGDQKTNKNNNWFEILSVLRSPNYLFSAPTPAPLLSIISAPALTPAPAPAIYCHLKLYYNSSTIRNMSQWRFFFILASSKRTALLEKQPKFPRYNMKCRGKPDTTWNIPRSITFSPLHFMLYHGKSITFVTVCKKKIN